MPEALRISCDNSALDVVLIHAFLSEQSAWAQGIPLATVQKSIMHSLCFGGFLGTAQVAFARVISDFATFANLVDVFVLPEHRGKGHSKTLVRSVIAHPDLQRLRRFTLATANAHGLYAQFGFSALHKPESHMERYDAMVYTSASHESDS
ncbi:MAG: GNAT family N-acetyltransferase [Betaproteobacteria bacterium]